ncbi:MAG: hypothetical protein ACYC9O_17890, partial [Candidatus Latescibacterota bacterium]
MMRYAFSLFLFLLAVPNLFGQEPSSDLKLDSYEIIGKDTSTFTITGDRLSTVEFSPEPLVLPSETRPVHTSHGLLPEDTVFRRGETLGKRSGIFASFDGVFGSRTAGDFDLGASYDADDRAVTMRIVSRSQKEN